MNPTPDITPSDIVVIEGPEQARVKDPPDLADAGLPPVVGAQAWQVFRATRGAPEIADGRGWTYNHHIDMAVWRGRYYVAWNQCEKDEDIWPSREVYSTSADGATWDPPRELFPQGISTCLRMYFYVAPNGRMLVIAGLRTSTEEVQEETKGSMVVRQIMSDHALGQVYALQLVGNTKTDLPVFDSSPDAAFVEACRHLLGNAIFLEQQDLGTLLQDRRMKWHLAENWPGGIVPGDSEKWRSGKAFSFFLRPDGLRVGVSKMGFTTASADNGQTWVQPVVPPTLVTGKAKVWTQQTADGKYALVYNPTTRSRFPLIVVSGKDGQHFGGMRVVQGELPRQRYTGRFRSVGPQYTRGISEWSSDGSIRDDAMWLVYSMSKEDIWVSRVPLPITPDMTAAVDDDFSKFVAGPRVANWNTYQPRWASVKVEGGQLKLSNRDPYDYATAARLFPAAANVQIELTLTAAQADRGRLEIDLATPFDAAAPVRVALDDKGQITVAIKGETTVLASYTAGRPFTLGLCADSSRGVFSVTIDGQIKLPATPFAATADTLHRVVLRTGDHRNLGGTEPVDPATDKPTAAAEYSLQRLIVR